MKDIRPALRDFLLADPTVNSMVGGQRIHYGRLPQGQTADSVVYNKITELGDYHMQGDSGLVLARMQFDSWSTSADAAGDLANAVNDRLSGQSGDIGSNPVTVRGQFLVNGRDEYDPVAKLYRASRDYEIWYAAR